jgi:DNA-binding NarL/FixJ family response regulator
VPVLRHLGSVLIVDDEPDKLAPLYRALDAAGYTVVMAHDGHSALQRAAQAEPDMVLLDTALPDMDGFEVARCLKLGPDTAHLLILFMSEQTNSAQVLTAFEAGGVDCVAKSMALPELLARMAAHMRAARQARQARNALDAYGHATIAVHVDDAANGVQPGVHITVQATGQVHVQKPAVRPRLIWQTPLARKWLPSYFDSPPDVLPEALLQWLRLSIQGEELRPLTVVQSARQLVCTLQGRTADEDWLVVLREVSDAATVEATMQAFRLTMRESEVLYWVVKGKTNRDVGDILGSSTATVKKHLERVYEKLGVETRTAAAAMAMQKVRALNPA